MEGVETSIGDLLTRTLQLAIQLAPTATVSLVILTGLGVASDFRSEGVGGNAGYSIVSTIVAYVVTVKGLKRLGFLEDAKPKRSILAAVGLGILTGLGTLIGFVLLIVPGVILLTRWCAALPILLSEDVTITGAIRRSWDDTEGRFWLIFGFLVIVYVPLVLVAITYIVITETELTVPVSVVGNALLSAASIGGYFGSVAVYASLRTPAELSEVFA